MANEAVLKLRTSDPIDFTCADGVGIEKGTLLKMTDPKTASISNGTGDVLAGIAAREKIANDGRTQISVFRSGVFDMLASGAITVGSPVCAATSTASNVVKFLGGAAAGGISGAAYLGYALETASDGETIEVFVNVGGSN